jgi:hypothetical protein
MIMSVEQSVECLAGETEVLGGNLPQCLIVWAGVEPNPGRHGGKPATNHLVMALNFVVDYNG